jgi:hypothetical protein
LLVYIKYERLCRDLQQLHGMQIVGFEHTVHAFCNSSLVVFMDCGLSICAPITSNVAEGLCCLVGSEIGSASVEKISQLDESGLKDTRIEEIVLRYAKIHASEVVRQEGHFVKQQRLSECG